mmetsp:Transcript_48122/g.112526  ORF Transcript_48122/g.112526 Transcript_48122/m.112526 type:complete len:90 (+) Transcript_48122:979-1248(+)
MQRALEAPLAPEVLTPQEMVPMWRPLQTSQKSRPPKMLSRVHHAAWSFLGPYLGFGLLARMAGKTTEEFENELLPKVAIPVYCYRLCAH